MQPVVLTHGSVRGLMLKFPEHVERLPEGWWHRLSSSRCHFSHVQSDRLPDVLAGSRRLGSGSGDGFGRIEDLGEAARKDGDFET